MKNRQKWLILTAITVIFGLVVSACDNGGNAHTHDWGGWTETTAATCSAEGVETSTCSGCGETQTQDIDIDPDNHDLQPVEGSKLPTCTELGYGGQECADCDYTVGVGDIPALGHDHGTSGTGSLICKRDNCNHQYAIGNTGPAGGIIFYVAPSGITIQGYTGATGTFAEYTAYYLEAAPANETESRWGAASNNTLIDGVTTFTSIDQNNTLTIGVGRKDTQTIVNSAAFAALTNTAAQRCASKDTGGKTDWFLPSLGELNEMYKARVAGVTGIPTTSYLWSSSQRYDDSAWSQSFGNDLQRDYNKNNYYYVRAIRAF